MKCGHCHETIPKTSPAKVCPQRRQPGHNPDAHAVCMPCLVRGHAEFQVRLTDEMGWALLNILDDEISGLERMLTEATPESSRRTVKAALEHVRAIRARVQVAFDQFTMSDAYQERH